MTEQPRPPQTSPARAAAAPSAQYERIRWESAVLARQLHRNDKLVALVLAHYAGPGGLLPEDGVQRTDRMHAMTGLSPASTRQALKNLQKAGLLWRPSGEGRTPTEAARPITLTVPARRWTPRHTGARP